MSRFRASVVVAANWVVFACGSADPSPSAPPDEPPTPPVESSEPVAANSESMLAFSIDGRDGPMGAQAQLRVIEGEPLVHLEITGGDDGSNVVLINLGFDGVADSMGPHLVPFGLPEAGNYVANASFDGAWYYSQGGEIEVTLSADGSISGHFDLSLALDALEAMGEPAVFERTDDATAVSGAFSGKWTLYCRSRLAGHMTLVPGGDFCDNLAF